MCKKENEPYTAPHPEKSAVASVIQRSSSCSTDHWNVSSEQQLTTVHQIQIQKEKQMKTKEKYMHEELTWSGIRVSYSQKKESSRVSYMASTSTTQMLCRAH